MYLTDSEPSAAHTVRYWAGNMAGRRFNDVGQGLAEGPCFFAMRKSIGINQEESKPKHAFSISSVVSGLLLITHGIEVEDRAGQGQSE